MPGEPEHRAPTQQEAAVSATLSDRGLAVTPGEMATVGVVIRNGGSKVEQFVVHVTGPAAQWATVEPPALSVYPGQQSECVVRFAPPRSSAALVGRYWFMVHATSTVNPGLAARQDGVLDIGPFRELAARLVPQNSAGRRRTRHRVTLINNGNLTEPVQIQASDSDGLLRFSVPGGEVPVPVGETDVDVAVRPPTRLFGKPRQHRFQVLVVPRPPTPPIPLDGGREALPLVARWVPAAAAVVALLLGAVGAATLIVPKLVGNATPPPSAQPATTAAAPVVPATSQAAPSKPGPPSTPAGSHATSSPPSSPPPTVRRQVEALLPAVSATAPVRAQTNCCGVRWDNSAQLFFTPGGPNNSVTVRWSVPVAGTYELFVVSTLARDYGIFTLAVDGRRVGDAFDGFHTPEVVIGPAHSFGQLRLTTAAHTMTLTVIGKNTGSVGYYAGLDYIELRPVT